MGLGVEDMIGQLDPESPEFGAAIHLLKPDGMGRTFKILVQHRGIEPPDLDGLKFKPFFGSALATNQAQGEGQEAIGQSLPSSRSPLTPSLQA
ncbi:MAG: hypothetical protein A2V62_05560 [Nitrospirae bacterium RBG_19FT_COMBO_58_9]|nr:MAG: hypothetical protein A2V62_05560 [Nitrospirae bacterium RBG_19FT_COMBO_58_9]